LQREFMEKYLTFLTNIPLFNGIFKQDIENLLRGIARVKSFERQDIILLAGTPVLEFGIVLEGRVEVARLDPFGRRIIMDIFGPGNLFAEALACAGTADSPVTVTAYEPCAVMLINCKMLLSAHKTAAGEHLLSNLLKLIAQKNTLLNNKIDIVSKPTTRAKIAAYLLWQMKVNGGGRTFKIPLDREGLADYLSVNRAALSRELSQMQKESIIGFSKNNFEIKDIRKLA